MNLWVEQVEVVRINGKWVVRELWTNGQWKRVATRRLKRDAVNVATGVCLTRGPAALRAGRSLELVIKKRNGTIARDGKRSFGKDPVGNG